jgi:hypothetical protein
MKGHSYFPHVLRTAFNTLREYNTDTIKLRGWRGGGCFQSVDLSVVSRNIHITPDQMERPRRLTPRAES